MTNMQQAPSSCHNKWWIYIWVFLMTCIKSLAPRMHRNFRPGTSLTRFFCTKTVECSCRLCPIPGTKQIFSCPLLSRTRTHFRLAEFGFFGFLITVFSTIPRICGRPCNGCRARNILGMTGPWSCIFFNKYVPNRSSISLVICEQALWAVTIHGLLATGLASNRLDALEDDGVRMALIRCRTTPKMLRNIVWWRNLFTEYGTNQCIFWKY